MKYEIRIKRSASEELLNLPDIVARRVLKVIGSLSENPRPQGCVKLKGTKSEYRLRLGNYRIIYTILDKEVLIIVIRIAHRKQVYR